jgi:D-alanyl-D-alanine dipeptidase
MNMPSILTLLFAALLLCAPAVPTAQAAGLPPGFVYAEDVIPDLILEMRYFGVHNFVGTKVDGYESPRCILTRPAAAALAKVQAELKPMGLAVKIYDCYRPRRAVAHFERWARDINDVKTKAEFYPTVDKRDLFKLGYVADKSSHSRGSTVDLNIVPLPATPQPKFSLSAKQVACTKPVGQRWPDNGLDMGTGFDCFNERSHTANPSIPAQARANRALLQSLMDKHGFVNYDKEWWHYTLGGEPFPDTYFDFPIR